MDANDIERTVPLTLRMHARRIFTYKWRKDTPARIGNFTTMQAIGFARSKPTVKSYAWKDKENYVCDWQE